MSTIILGSAYAGGFAGVAGQALQGHDSHGSHDGYAPISPDELGGAYDFLDLKNRRVTAADFKGHWTLLFFGYARCRGSCPMATPKIVKAARTLRAQGIETRAVFVDIEPPPQHIIALATGRQVPVGGHDHGDMNRIAAMRGLAGTWGSDLTVLTGTRLQLSNAARAFKVMREHKPPRQGEVGHSIDHSSRIYFVAPDTKVAGYGAHNAEPAELVATVARLSRKTRSG